MLTPDDDYISPRCWYSPSAERRGPKAMLRAAGRVDPGYVPDEPASHRVQSPEPPGLCGCWMAANRKPPLDLRNAPLHGTPAHKDHVRHNMHHAWCAICSPGSVATHDAILAKHAPLPSPEPQTDEPVTRRHRPQPEVSHDPNRYGWLCPDHAAATVRTSPRGRRYVGCPDCNAFTRVAPPSRRPSARSRVVAPSAPLLGSSARPVAPDASGCPECSRIVREAPSPSRAFARLVVNDVHRREHAPLTPVDDLPF